MDFPPLPPSSSSDSSDSHSSSLNRRRTFSPLVLPSSSSDSSGSQSSLNLRTFSPLLLPSPSDSSDSSDSLPIRHSSSDPSDSNNQSLSPATILPPLLLPSSSSDSSDSHNVQDIRRNILAASKSSDISHGSAPMSESSPSENELEDREIEYQNYGSDEFIPSSPEMPVVDSSHIVDEPDPDGSLEDPIGLSWFITLNHYTEIFRVKIQSFISPTHTTGIQLSSRCQHWTQWRG